VVDETGTVAEAAIAGHERDETTARRLLGSPEPKVRAAALGALARMERLTSGDVAAGLADASPVVRRRAVELAIAHPDVPLLPLLDDPDADVVEQAAWACGERLPADSGTVARLVQLVGEHGDALVREAAVAALGAIGEPEGLPAILAATTDKPAVRRRAVLALAPFEGPEVDAALQRALADRDWQVRQAAEDILSA
jgi:HEAT repeat protein